MASGRAVLLAATIPWLVTLLSLPLTAAADPPPTITISPTDPPTSHSVQVRLYEFFSTGVGITLQNNQVQGNVVEVEHFFDLTNLPTITEFDETFTYEFLGGDYTFRWIRHHEYAGQIHDSVLELPFTVPLTEPVTLSLEAVPSLQTWALTAAAGLLILALTAGLRRRAPVVTRKT